MNPYPPSSVGSRGGDDQSSIAPLMKRIGSSIHDDSSSESDFLDLNEKEGNILIKLSTMLTSTLLNDPFFLDFPLFVTSFEEMYKLNDLMTPGPSALVDFYKLYCGIVEGDKHIHRTIQLLSSFTSTCIQSSPSFTVDTKVDEYVLKARSKLKRYKKLNKFFMDNSLPDAIHEPFILSESTLRSLLYSIWEKNEKIKVNRKKMAKIYLLYCQHILNLKDFFYGIFKISIMFPHGPYNIEKIEQFLVEAKSVDKIEFQEGSLVFILALYLREDVGIDNELFLRLPSAARYVVANEPLHLVLLSTSQTDNNGDEDAMDDGCKFPQFCCISPVKCDDPTRVQFQRPGELQNPDYTQVFSWSFFPLEEHPGVFYIRNEQWKEFLILEEAENNPRVCRVSTSVEYKSKQNEFRLVLEDNLIRIHSNFNEFALTVDPLSSRCAFLKSSPGTPLLPVIPTSPI